MKEMYISVHIVQETVLHVAASKGHAEVALVLIREGVDLETTTHVSDCHGLSSCVRAYCACCVHVGALLIIFVVDWI